MSCRLLICDEGALHERRFTGDAMRFTTIIAASVVLAAPALGHHSDAGLDMESVVTFEGTVTEFAWRNPHVYTTVETTDERGEPVEWALQMGSALVMGRRGWSRDALAVGDRVTVHAHPSVDGRPYGILDSIEKEGGITLSTAPAPPEVTAAASTLAGIWLADGSQLASYPGGYDGFFTTNLVLTEAGRAARDAYDPLSAENPESTCVGRPTPGMIVSSGLYPLEIRIDENEEIIEIRTEYWDERRTVYMDGRPHPPMEERFDSGYSIGSWEGDTLVVDVRNFSDHRSPYQIGVPSGGQKRVVERYRLLEDGTRISLEFTVEDPEYLAEPMTATWELIYSPHLELTTFDCDPDATSRFLPD